MRIYRLSNSVEDNRLLLDFTLKKNRSIPCGKYLFLDEANGIPQHIEGEIQFEIKNKQFDRWDYFPVPGAPGIVSQKARKEIEKFSRGFIKFWKCYVNTTEYYFLVRSNPLDCFDEKKSQFDKNKETGHIFYISKYAFNLSKIDENLVFHVPQSRDLFATGGAYDVLVKNLKGIGGKLLYEGKKIKE